MVTVLPTAASAKGGADAAVRWARRYFGALEASVEGVMVLDADGAADPVLADALRRSRFIYLAGGSPSHLLQTLSGSAAWEAILDARDDGAVLAGSSAGAMVLGPSGLAVVDCEVVPHHESRRTARPGGRAIGIGSRAALLWDGERWEAVPNAAVTLYGYPSLAELPPPSR